MKQIMSLIVSMMLMRGSYADITVSDVKVFSGYPWKEVVVGYTITGHDERATGIRLTATEKVANNVYTVETGEASLTGAEITEGRHVLRWNSMADGYVFSSSELTFKVSVIIGDGGVRLWKGGPYWAECNVGATKPEEYGYYFYFGDTAGYKRVDLSWNAVDGSSNGFSFSGTNCPTMDKDKATLQSQGYIDATGNLVAKYDAATKHLGVPWRMPTEAEWNALISNCTTTWTTRNNVYGRLVTGKGAYASKSIFLPAAGYGYDSGLYDVGSYGVYWSSTPVSGNFYCAMYLGFNSGYLYFSLQSRYRGKSVRPLRGSAQ